MRSSILILLLCILSTFLAFHVQVTPGILVYRLTDSNIPNRLEFSLLKATNITPSNTITTHSPTSPSLLNLSTSNQCEKRRPSRSVAINHTPNRTIQTLTMLRCFLPESWADPTIQVSSNLSTRKRGFQACAR